MLTSIHPCRGFTRAGTPLLVIALLPAFTQCLIVAVFFAVFLSLAYNPIFKLSQNVKREDNCSIVQIVVGGIPRFCF